MFAGIHAVVFDPSGAHAVAMLSHEGEEVRFVAPVDVQGAARVNEWLAAVETQMRVALANQLAAAIAALTLLMEAPSPAGLDRDAYLAWVDAYPAQVVVLAAQA
jgi:dynein heavy chain 1